MDSECWLILNIVTHREVQWVEYQLNMKPFCVYIVLAYGVNKHKLSTINTDLKKQRTSTNKRKLWNSSHKNPYNFSSPSAKSLKSF